ncbi:unnamed protein product [Cuscuta campestris]|uniref:Retrotransposon gag domain-containing protein n=1 Tax=Cuscuta campestris TaxID=132261 RepID=A0A484M2Q7_9ASTE|nr:unnamed protein product [Cuscuta campestris]
MFQSNGLSMDRVKLSLFPFSLRYRAARWLNTFPDGHFKTWEALHQAFMHEYFPPSAMVKINSIQNFRQAPMESMCEAWERFKELKVKCPPALIDSDSLMFYFYQGLTVPSKKELDHSFKLGSFLEMTPEENEELVDRLTSNAKYWYEDRAPPPKAGMYEVDQFTALKASMESIVKQTIKEHLGASHPRPNLYTEPVNQAEIYGSGSHHQSDLVLSCEHCSQNHLSSACPLIEPPPPSKAKDVNLAQYANKGEGPWAQNNQEQWRERNNFSRNNRLRDDYKQESLVVAWGISEPNPREQLWAITLRSGKELQGPEVEADIEEVPVDTSIGTTSQKKSESTPQETRREETPSSQPQLARQTQLNTIPFPTRVKKSKDEKAFQKFLDVIGQVEVKMPLVDVLTKMPKYDPAEFCNSVKVIKDKGSVEDLLSLEIAFQEPKCEEVCVIKTQSEPTNEAKSLELKPLPSHLEYAFLDSEGQCPVVIASDLTPDQKKKLLAVLRMHKQAIAWKLEDIQGISPAYCTHKIAIEDGFEPVVQAQRRPAFPAATRANVHLVGSGPIERFEMWGRHRSLTESVYLSSAVLTDYGYAEEMEQLLRGTRWHRLFTMRAESSLPLTIEFLCSLELEPSTGSRSMNFQSIDSHTTLTFTLLGRGFQLTIAELATHLGLYSREETFWIQPTWRILSFVLSTSFFGRPLNTDRVYPDDMMVFWSLHTRQEANVAVFVARFLYSQSMGNRTHIVCGFVVTILFRSLEGAAPIPQAQMLMRDLDAGMLRNAHIRRRLGASSTESNGASSYAPSTSGASSQVSSRRATRRRPTSQAAPATTQADPTLEWARRILEQQDTIMQRMSEIGQQQASQAESFALLRRTFTGFYSDVHIGLTPRSPEGDDPSASVPPP